MSSMAPTCRSTRLARSAKTEQRRSKTQKARSNERAFCLQSGLQQRDAVADDQAVFVEVADTGIGAHHGIAPAHAEVFQRAFLNGVADVQVAFPFLAIATA